MKALFVSKQCDKIVSMHQREHTTNVDLLMYNCGKDTLSCELFNIR